MPFNIVSQEVAEQVAKMTLSGDLDANSAPVFLAELDKAFQQKPRHLVLFVPGLIFLASAGVRALLVALRKCPGLDIYVIAPQETVVDTLQRASLKVIIQDEYKPLR